MSTFQSINAVAPSMEFVASEKLIYWGDSVELKCTVHMAQPPRFPVVTLGSSSSLPSHEVDEIMVDDHTAVADVWVYEQIKQREDYICVMEIYDNKDSLVERLEKNLSIYSYSTRL